MKLQRYTTSLIGLLSSKRRTLAFSSAVALLFILLGLTRPWSKPVDFFVAGETSGEVHFERPDGSAFRYPFRSTEDSAPVTFHSLRPRRVTLRAETSDAAAQVTLGTQSVQLRHAGEHTIDHWPGQRSAPATLASLLLTGGLLFLVCYFLVGGYSALSTAERRRLLLHTTALVFVVATIFGLSAPGILWFDTYAATISAARGEVSAFTGPLYGLVLMAGYQLFPTMHLVHALNAICVFLVLLGVLHRALLRQKQIVFWCGLALLFSYPANFNAVLSANRDVLAMWTTGFLALLLLDKTPPRGLVTFLLLLCLGLRNDLFAVGVLVLPFLVAGRKWAWASALGACLAATYLLSVAALPAEKRAVYQSTVLVNPLGHILKHEYPAGLARETEEQLAGFFRVSALREFHNDYEIDPFHRGGVRFDDVAGTYPAFRTTALRLIAKHWPRFLENRLRMTLAMLGFSSVSPALGIANAPESSSYLRENLTRIGQLESAQEIFAGLPAAMRWDYYQLPWQLKSYLFPLLVLALSFILGAAQARWVLGLLVLRLLLVAATTPAPMYKYNFNLWVFSCFVFIWVDPCLPRWKGRRASA